MAETRLEGRVARVRDLAESEVRELYALFARHYDNVAWPAFASDFREKDYVLLLADGLSGQIHGFSTQKLLRSNADGGLRALYSGDTVIDRARWGEQELVRSWCRFAGALWAEEPQTPLYWFLICKGYRTYLYLPVFFRAYYPCHDVPTPPALRSVLDALARMKFPDSYVPEKGLLEFPDSRGNLTPELAQVAPSRLKDPRVRFFLERNPDYARGSELLCLTAISEGNMRGLALRLFLEGKGLGRVSALTRERPRIC